MLFSIRREGTRSSSRHQVSKIIVHTAAAEVRSIALYRTEFTRYSCSVRYFFGILKLISVRYGSVYTEPNRTEKNHTEPSIIHTRYPSVPLSVVPFVSSGRKFLQDLLNFFLLCFVIRKCRTSMMSRLWLTTIVRDSFRFR